MATIYSFLLYIYCIRLDRFQQEWENLDRDTHNICLFEWPHDEDSFSYQQGRKVLDWGQSLLASQSFPREDYRELMELTVIF